MSDVYHVSVRNYRFPSVLCGLPSRYAIEELFGAAGGYFVPLAALLATGAGAITAYRGIPFDSAR